MYLVSPRSDVQDYWRHRKVEILAIPFETKSCFEWECFDVRHGRSKQIK